MKATQPQLKPAAKIAVAVMVVLLIGAFVFYKERMFFIDAPHICFRLLNYKTFVIEEHRYGSFITQMVPLIGAQLHLSLKTILIAYSASFNLFYLIVMLLLVFRYRQYGMAILMVLYYTLFVSDAYYWTNNEVHQGTAWMFLFFAVIFHNAIKQRQLILQLIPFLLLAALAVFTHPLVMLSVIFLWVYFFLNKEQWPYKPAHSLLFSMLLVIVVSIKFYISNAAGYDSNKMEEAVHMNLHSIWHAIRSPMMKKFLHDCVINYWVVPLIVCFGIAALIRQKKWLPLCWMLLMTAVFMILMGLTYGNNQYDRHTQFYMESEWMSLGIILAAPFVFNFLPGLKWQVSCVLLAAIFVIRLIYIGISAQVFTDRIEFIEQGLKQMRKKGWTKVVLIKQSSLIEDKLLMDWGLPDESLFASVLDGDRPALTYCEMPAEQLDKNVPKDSKTMIACFRQVKAGLNYGYFPIDTTRPYIIITYEDFNQK